MEVRLHKLRFMEELQIFKQKKEFKLSKTNNQMLINNKIVFRKVKKQVQMKNLIIKKFKKIIIAKLKQESI